MTLYANVPADKEFVFKAPALAEGEYITGIEIRFGSVPSGFAVGDSITMTFRVWDNPPSKTLTNIGMLYYEVNGIYKEFITGASSGMVAIDGYFGTPKTGDSNQMTMWLVLLGVSFVGILGIPVLRRRRRNKAGFLGIKL